MPPFMDPDMPLGVMDGVSGDGWRISLELDAKSERKKNDQDEVDGMRQEVYRKDA